MQTPLDLAHDAMENAPDDGQAALKYYERLADAELFLLLAQDAGEDTARPQIFETSDGKFALVFDREDRLAEFVDTPAPFVAMSGRRIAKILAGEGIGLGLNLGVAPSSMLLEPHAIDWLHSALGATSVETTARPVEFHPPKGLPENLITAFDTKLANMSGVVAAAYLVGVTYEGGQRGHMMALIDVSVAAQPGVAEAFAETLQFSGIEAGQLDVTFLPLDSPHIESVVKTGLGFEIPELILPKPFAPVAPGMDPDSPPKLR